MQYLHHGIETHRNRNPTVLLLASGWFWSPRPQTSVKSRNSFVSPSADIRRHVTACKAAVFLGRRHSQTQRQVIPKHFGLVRRHLPREAQTSADIRRHPQTHADRGCLEVRTICSALQRYYSASSTQSVDCVWLPIEARHCVGTTETLGCDPASERNARPRCSTICCSDITPAPNGLASTAHGHTMRLSLPCRKREADKGH